MINTASRKHENDHQGGGVSVNFDDREIYLSGSIDNEKSGSFLAAVRTMDKKPGLITVVISSTGGIDGAGWAIYDAILLCSNHVLGMAYGECQSIAALILQGCGTRLLSPNCRFMVHNGSVEMATTVTQLPAIAKETLDLTRAYYEAIAQRSGLSVRKVKALCDAESFMGAEKACQYGMADGIISKTLPRKKRKKR